MSIFFHSIQLTPHKLSTERNGAGPEAPPSGQKTRSVCVCVDLRYYVKVPL